MRKHFADRTDAGLKLATLLTHLRGTDALVLALPRGGVPVGCEVAHALRAPLDVLNVRKLGAPWNPELAMGAIGPSGVRVLNPEVVAMGEVTAETIERATAAERRELERREQLYRRGRAMPRIAGRTVVLVDDGIATGATVRAAIAVIRAQKPARLVLAVPVADASIARELAHQVDEFACVITTDDLVAIGYWYAAFPQVGDDEVLSALARARTERTAEPAMAR